MDLITLPCHKTTLEGITQNELEDLIELEVSEEQPSFWKVLKFNSKNSPYSFLIELVEVRSLSLKKVCTVGFTRPTAVPTPSALIKVPSRTPCSSEKK